MATFLEKPCSTSNSFCPSGGTAKKNTSVKFKRPNFRYYSNFKIISFHDFCVNIMQSHIFRGKSLLNWYAIRPVWRKMFHDQRYCRNLVWFEFDWNFENEKQNKKRSEIRTYWYTICNIKSKITSWSHYLWFHFCINQNINSSKIIAIFSMFCKILTDT